MLDDQHQKIPSALHGEAEISRNSWKNVYKISVTHMELSVANNSHKYSVSATMHICKPQIY